MFQVAVNDVYSFPNTKYAKMVAKQSGEIFAYFERSDAFVMPEGMSLWITSVFDVWTIPDHEYETYAEAFGVAPIINMEDIGVIAFGEVYVMAPYEIVECTDNIWEKLPGTEPWFLEATRKDDGNCE